MQKKISSRLFGLMECFRMLTDKLPLSNICAAKHFVVVVSVVVFVAVVVVVIAIAVVVVLKETLLLSETTCDCYLAFLSKKKKL